GLDGDGRRRTGPSIGCVQTARRCALVSAPGSSSQERGTEMSVRFTYTSGAFSSEVDDAFDAYLRSAREHDPEPLPHVIAGESVAEGDVFERENPSHVDEVASRAHTGTEGIVERTVAAAKAASGDWRRMPYEERIRHLRRAAQAISERHL